MATRTDPKTFTTVAEIAPDRPVATETGASETALSRSRSRGEDPVLVGRVPPQLLDPRTCETCHRARGRLRGAHVVCDECFELHWDEVEPPSVQIRTTRPDACGCVEPGRSADPDCVVCQGSGRMGLGSYTRILTRKVDGRTVAHHVAQSMRYAPRPFDEAKLQPVEDLSKKSESRVGLRDDAAEAFLRAAGDAGALMSTGTRPKELISDPKLSVERSIALLRWAIEVVGDDGDKSMIPRLVVVGEALAKPALDLGVVAESLKRHGRGNSRRTLEGRREKLRELGRVLPRQGASWATCLDALASFPELVTFVSRLK